MPLACAIGRSSRRPVLVEVWNVHPWLGLLRVLCARPDSARVRTSTRSIFGSGRHADADDAWTSDGHAREPTRHRSHARRFWYVMDARRVTDARSHAQPRSLAADAARQRLRA